MLKKNILDVMKQEVAEGFEGIKLELLGIEHGEKESESGEKEKFSRLELEVPKGNGGYSRCRFSCKTEYSPNCFSQEELDEGVMVLLHGLTISYIDNRGTVYFKCESFTKA